MSVNVCEGQGLFVWVCVFWFEVCCVHDFTVRGCEHVSGRQTDTANPAFLVSPEENNTFTMSNTFRWTCESVGIPQGLLQVDSLDFCRCRFSTADVQTDLNCHTQGIWPASQRNGWTHPGDLTPNSPPGDCEYGNVLMVVVCQGNDGFRPHWQDNSLKNSDEDNCAVSGPRLQSRSSKGDWTSFSLFVSFLSLFVSFILSLSLLLSLRLSFSLSHTFSLSLSVSLSISLTFLSLSHTHTHTHTHTQSTTATTELFTFTLLLAEFVKVGGLAPWRWRSPQRRCHPALSQQVASGKSLQKKGILELLGPDSGCHRGNCRDTSAAAKPGPALSLEKQAGHDGEASAIGLTNQVNAAAAAPSTHRLSSHKRGQWELLQNDDGCGRSCVEARAAAAAAQFPAHSSLKRGLCDNHPDNCRVMVKALAASERHEALPAAISSSGSFSDMK